MPNLLAVFVTTLVTSSAVSSLECLLDNAVLDQADYFLSFLNKIAHSTRTDLMMLLFGLIETAVLSNKSSIFNYLSK